MKAKVLFLLALLILSTSCSYIDQARMLASFEYKTGIWMDNDMNLKKGEVCRITNVKVLKDFGGNGYLITGKCDNVPHVFFKTKEGVKIDLTADCKKFEPFMLLKLENYEIKDVKVFKDELKLIDGELISSDVVNFYYLKTAVKIRE